MSERPLLEYLQDRLMRMLRLALLAASLLPGAALAQSHSPVLDALRQNAEHAQRNLVEACIPRRHLRRHPTIGRRNTHGPTMT